MIVYYTTHYNLFVHEPEPLLHSFFSEQKEKFKFKERSNLHDLKKCPAFVDILKNCFVIKNCVDYDLTWTGFNFKSSFYNQQFFNEYVEVREPDMGLVSYTHPRMRFFSEESLKMTLLPPFMHDTDIKRNAIFIPGKYDIGMHFRGLEIPLLFSNSNSTIQFKANEPQYYVKFHTDKKIKFVKFFFTEELMMIERAVMSLRGANLPKPLSFFYNIFTKNYRKKVLKIIKENVME